MKVVLALASLALFAGTAYAQNDDREALKKKILAEVEKKLKAEEARILDEIGKIIDEELKKGTGTKPAKAEPPKPVDPPKPVEPAKAKPKGRGFLGIRPGDVTADELSELKLKSAVRIDTMVEDSPAAKAGLQEGDIIASIDGEALADAQSLPAVVQKKGAGATITLKIFRDKKEQTIKVTLGGHPDDNPQPDKPPEPSVAPPGKQPVEPPPPQPPDKSEDELRNRIKKFLDKEGKDQPKKDEPKKDEPRKEEPKKDEPKPEKASGKPWLGLEPEELTDDVRAQLDLEDGVGLGVAAVRENSPAAKAGLVKGDILVKIDGAKLKGEDGLAKFMAAAKAGQSVELSVLRKGKETKIKLTLGTKP